MLDLPPGGSDADEADKFMAVADNMTSRNALSASSGRLAVDEAFLRRRRLLGAAVGAVLFVTAAISVLTTAGIVYVLLSESLKFFAEVSVWDFLTDTEWTPVFEIKRFGIVTLLSGTLVSSAIALLIAVPAGTALAIYLSEFAHGTVRETVKPILELIAGIP